MMTMLGKSGSVGSPFYSDRFMSEAVGPCSWIIDARLGRWKALMMSYISSPSLLVLLLIKHDDKDEYSATMISLIKLLKIKCNKDNIKSIQLDIENQVIFSAGLSGHVYEWDIRDGRSYTSNNVPYQSLVMLRLSQLLAEIEGLKVGHFRYL